MVEILNDYIRKAQIRCYHCKAILEITRDDLKIQNGQQGSHTQHIKCPVCGNDVFIGGEIVYNLLKDF